jgi:hypothetical protein
MLLAALLHAALREAGGAGRVAEVQNGCARRPSCTATRSIIARLTIHVR